VNADCPAAFFAAPSLRFIFGESRKADSPDTTQVIDQAHPVFSSIAFVQRLQSPAGIFGAPVTEPGFAEFKEFAIFDDAVRARDHLVPIIFAATRARIFCPEVAMTYPAVHPARGYQASFSLHVSNPA
jgi:hypothetical protein